MKEARRLTWAYIRKDGKATYLGSNDEEEAARKKRRGCSCLGSPSELPEGFVVT